jgi:chemotaxis signal transduction protein
MSDGDAVGEALAALRQAFDATFALPPPARARDGVRLLLVGVGGEGRVAVRLDAVQGLEALPRRVPVPGAPTELLGLVGLRGRLVPVFSLARLLGVEGAGEPRWLLLAGAEDPLGLAVEAFHGQLEVEASEVRAAAGGGARPHVPELVRLDGNVCGVVDLPSVVAALRRRAMGPVEES